MTRLSAAIATFRIISPHPRDTRLESGLQPTSGGKSAVFERAMWSF
jgi:hypothetical protein